MSFNPILPVSPEIGLSVFVSSHSSALHPFPSPLAGSLHVSQLTLTFSLVAISSTCERHKGRQWTPRLCNLLSEVNPTGIIPHLDNVAVSISRSFPRSLSLLILSSKSLCHYPPPLPPSSNHRYFPHVPQAVGLLRELHSGFHQQICQTPLKGVNPVSLSLSPSLNLPATPWMSSVHMENNNRHSVGG